MGQKVVDWFSDYSYNVTGSVITDIMFSSYEFSAPATTFSLFLFYGY